MELVGAARISRAEAVGTRAATEGSCSVRQLDYPEKHYLDSARGWLELGNPIEAKIEADKIPWVNGDHPEVFLVRWRICAWLGNWNAAHDLARIFTSISPDRPTGWLCLAYSLFKLKRPLEAFLQLLHQADVFPQVSAIPYFLGCCCLEMGDASEAEKWLAKAKALNGKKGNDASIAYYANMILHWDETHPTPFSAGSFSQRGPFAMG